jgi:hypothetical protein
MGPGRTGYASEAELSREFCSALEQASSPWGEVALIKEFFYLRGRTDVIAVDREQDVIAFELKLERWTVALQQAYRNTSFAHLSYVVLPEHTASRAERHRDEFARRSVGLCYLRRGAVVISLPASRQEPIHPWLSEQVVTQANPDERGPEGAVRDAIRA